MSDLNYLLAVLNAVGAAGYEVADVQRLDMAGELTRVSVDWAPGMCLGTSSYMQGWNDPHGERTLANEILADLAAHEGISW